MDEKDHRFYHSDSVRAQSSDGGHYYDDTEDHEQRLYSTSCSLGQLLLNPCLCLFQTFMAFCQGALKYWKFRRKPGCWSKLAVLVAFGILLGFQVLLHVSLSSNVNLWDPSSSMSLPSIRRPFSSFLLSSPLFAYPSTGQAVPEPAMRIPSLEFDRSDFGGWTFFRKFFLPTDPLDRFISAKIARPDFGGIQLTSTGGQPREILFTDEDLGESTLGRRAQAYHKDEMNYEYVESIEDQPQECRRPSWKNRYYPTCNALHDLDLTRDYDSDEAQTVPGDDQFFDSFYISHGYYRDVWVVHQPDLNVKTILKKTRYKHSYSRSTFFNVLQDALVMERLAASPRIVDVYGHCGTAVWVEAIPYEVEEVIIHGDGFVDPQEKDQLTEVSPEGQTLPKPLNEFTVPEKLEMALEMAMSLAEMHGFKGGVIVHDDVQLCQWLRTRNGTLKLGDFNRAEIMDYNEEKGEYCRYNNGHSYGNYRAPEEFAGKDLDEKIDVFSFGNNIYALLTGLWVFYDDQNDDSVQKKVIHGLRAYVDPGWKKRSYVEQRLVEIMEQCWEQDTEKRIDIFEIVRQLRQIDQETNGGSDNKEQNGIDKERGASASK